MMGEEGTWETGEKKKGLRQKCGGLLKGQDTHKLSSNFQNEIYVLTTIQLPMEPYK